MRDIRPLWDEGVAEEGVSRFSPSCAPPSARLLLLRLLIVSSLPAAHFTSYRIARKPRTVSIATSVPRLHHIFISLSLHRFTSRLPGSLRLCLSSSAPLRSFSESPLLPSPETSIQACIAVSPAVFLTLHPHTPSPTYTPRDGQCTRGGLIR